VDGVTRLGDLWNCVTSKTVGQNLFEDYLDGAYVNASQSILSNIKLSIIKVH
jgi:hypothetical protein